MAQLSFMDVAQGLSSVTPPRKLGKSIFEAREKSRGLFDSDLSSESVSEQDLTTPLSPLSRRSISNSVNRLQQPHRSQNTMKRSEEQANRISFLQAGRYTADSLSSKHDVLSHVEKQNNLLVVNFFVDESVATHFRSTTVNKWGDREDEQVPLHNTSTKIASLVEQADRQHRRLNLVSCHDRAVQPALQATVNAHVCTFTLTGQLLRRWLALRSCGLNESNSISERSVYYHGFENERDRKSALFADVSLAICDLKGEIKFPLRKLVRNKKRWPVSIPQSFEKEKRPLSEVEIELMEIEEDAGKILKTVAERSELWFSQKSLLNLLGSKSFGDSGGWGQQCLAPPYYLKIYIPSETQLQRTLLSEEVVARQRIEHDALLRFGRQFATIYWNVFLHQDLLRREQWIIHQAQERHKLHRMFHFETHRAQRVTLENEENCLRSELLQHEVLIRHSVLHVEWERSQLALLVFHRALKIREESSTAFRTILQAENDARQLSMLLIEQKQRMTDYVSSSEDLVLSGWAMRLALMDAFEKRLIQSSLSQKTRN